MAELEREQWCPVITVRTLLVCVQALLSDPNVEEGCILNEEAAVVDDVSWCMSCCFLDFSAWLYSCQIFLCAFQS
jgi:hypothetical protein